jgi:hypothetical protein
MRGRNNFPRSILYEVDCKYFFFNQEIAQFLKNLFLNKFNFYFYAILNKQKKWYYTSIKGSPNPNSSQRQVRNCRN